MQTITNLTLSQIQANPVPVIEHWLARYSLLWWGGFASSADIERWARSGRDGLDERRAETLQDRGTAQVIRAAQFLDQAPRTANVNRKRGSYGWKHAAERFHKQRSPGADDYVGEGAFLIACWAMGIQTDRFGSGAYLALSEKAYIPDSWGVRA